MYKSVLVSIALLLASAPGGCAGEDDGFDFGTPGGGHGTGDGTGDDGSTTAGDDGTSDGEASDDTPTDDGNTEDGATSDDGASTGGGDDGGDTTDGGGTGDGGDPSYPKPDGSTCPDGFVLLYILNGGVLCTMECPNDGATTCQPGATGDADPWCSFPSEEASDADCTDTGTCENPDETCVEFVDTSLCRDDRSRCGLWCGETEKTCPDGMTCRGSFCGY
jgi:hypothetical protein